MARPPLPLGMPGSITVREAQPGAWVARCRFRDQDGVTRPLRKHGPTKSAARNALNETISARQRSGRQRAGELTPGSTFADAAGLFLTRVANRRADSTHALYEFHLKNTILPAVNVRRSLRSVRDEIDLGWMTPHTWRRTYATILDDEISFTDRMKADLLGQAKFLKDEYVSRGELHPEAAVVLDSAFGIAEDQ